MYHYSSYFERIKKVSTGEIFKPYDNSSLWIEYVEETQNGTINVEYMDHFPEETDEFNLAMAINNEASLYNQRSIDGQSFCYKNRAELRLKKQNLLISQLDYESITDALSDARIQISQGDWEKGLAILESESDNIPSDIFNKMRSVIIEYIDISYNSQSNIVNQVELLSKISKK